VEFVVIPLRTEEKAGCGLCINDGWGKASGPGKDDHQVLTEKAKKDILKAARDAMYWEDWRRILQ
jgi:hypothetical protein